MSSIIIPAMVQPILGVKDCKCLNLVKSAWMVTSDHGMKEAVKINAVEEKKAEYCGSKQKSRKMSSFQGV